MFCTVYLLRENGEKLSKEAVRAQPHVGWLYLGKDTRKFYPQEAARLFRSARDDVISVLVHPQVKTIQRGGMLIRGQEECVTPQMVNAAQAWWVVPRPSDPNVDDGTGDRGPPA